MKKIFKLTFVAFLTFNTIALSFAELNIDSVFSMLTENKVTCGDFTQEKKSAKMKRPLKSSGKFVFSQEGIAWQTVKPFPSTTAVTKDYMVQTSADGKKNVVDGSTNETFKSVAATISSVFSGNKSNLEKNFNIKDFSSTNDNWKMILTPKDATISSSLKEITLEGGKTLDKMEILQNENNFTKYNLSNQTFKQELSANEKALFKK